MKMFFLVLSLFLGTTFIVAQNYPIENADQLQKLVVDPDMAHIKMLIFDDSYVYADRFVYFALLQGMAKDKMPISVANSVLNETQGKNFIDKCEICEATKKAFSAYTANGTSYSGKKNPYPDLMSKTAGTRHTAIKNLIDKYTSSLSTLLELSTLEQERLQNALGNMRIQGMSGMHNK